MNSIAGKDGTTARAVQVGLVVALLAVSWLAVYAAGGTRTVAPHLFYLPVLYAALRFPPRVAVVAAVAAGILCGPLMPLDVEGGTAQALSNWSPRLAAFVVAALAASLLVRRDRRAAARLQATAAAELELAAQREATIQVLAHELRTPLTILSGGLATLEGRRLIDERGRPLAEAMQRAVARLEGVAVTVQATVGDEAEIYRNLEDTTFSGIVDDALAALSAVHDVRRVRRHIDLTHDQVQTSPAHLRVVVTCLLDNALRFAPASSLVDVTNRRTPDGFEIQIRDHGPGIADLDRLMAPFAQGDASITRDHQGLGLGLYAASRIVDRLGGTLTLTPADQAPGTVATVTLPVALTDMFDHADDDRDDVTVAVEASFVSSRERAPRCGVGGRAALGRGGVAEDAAGPVGGRPTSRAERRAGREPRRTTDATHPRPDADRSGAGRRYGGRTTVPRGAPQPTTSAGSSTSGRWWLRFGCR